MRHREECKDCEGTGDDRQGFPCLSCDGLGEITVVIDWRDVKGDLDYHNAKEEGRL